jgi:hypothetical protein
LLIKVMSEKKPVNLVNLSRTIWISLFTSVFYTTVGVIAVPSAQPNNISRQDLAQNNQETTTPASSDTNSETNPEATTTKKPVSEAEPTNTLEKAIIAELNRVRTNPQGYADWLESQKQYYQGMLLKLPGEQPIRTNRGLRSLEEAIAFLREQDKLPPISPSTALISTAKQQITAISKNQTINSENNLVYNKVTPEAIVMQLVVDDGFPDRPHRLAIFNQNHQNAGIACSEIPVYNNVCAIAYKGETTEVTQQPTENSDLNTIQPENQPETSATTNSDSDSNSDSNSNQLPTPPSVGTSVISKTAEEVIVNTESSSNANQETAAAETNSSTTPTTETNTPETETENTETETNSSTTPTTESNAPETETENTETETNSSTTPAAENTETETNSSTTPTTESNAPETETETTEAETNSSTTPTTESNTPETETIETETNSSTTPTTETNTPETETDSEVATNSDTNTTSEAVEIVEAGILQEGDETIPNDGSFYDSFPIEGSAGDSFTITLESSEFDTFLAIMDGDGNIIEQNDDISEKDSNSRLEITLPGNGTYSVIVNAYDKGGKGNYVLKVTR